MAGSFRPQSFTAKLACLAPGETIILPERHPISRDKPWRLERDVATAMNRNPYVKGRRFTTTRLMAVAGIMDTMPCVGITRVDDGTEP